MVNPYLPLTDGTAQVFQLNRVKGIWHPETMHFDVTERTPYTGPNCTQTHLQTHIPLAFPFIAQTVCGDGQPVEFNKARALYKSKWRNPDGFEYVGESMNEHGMLELPPIPLLHCSPVAGQQIAGSSLITEPGGNQFSFPWKSGCLHVGKPWDRWPDTVRMALLERPDEPSQRQGYNQIFARGIGEVHYWKGSIRADWTCDDGWEWYAI